MPGNMIGEITGMTKDEISGYSYRVIQASKTELIVIMYEMAQNYVKDALDEFEHANIDGFRSNLKKAQRVINKLSGSLDLNYEISSELLNLYLYMNNVIIKASIRKEADELRTVFEMLQKMGTAFMKVSAEDKSGPLMKNTQQVYAGLTYSNGGLNEYHDQIEKRGFTV